MASSGADFRRVIQRQRILLTIVIVSLVVCITGLIAVWNIKSPAQQALEQSPPLPSVLTAEVTSEVLAQQVVMRGDVVSNTISIRSLSTANPAIITATPKSNGDQIAEGDIIIEIAGRPIIALMGDIPAWRALAPDMGGKDVDQLQGALQRLGYLTSHSAGKFDRATGNAVKLMYKDRGYDPSCDSLGVEICLGEIVFLPILPSTVTSRDAQVGDDVIETEGGLVTLQAGEETVTAMVPGGQEAGLAPGLAVRLTDETSNRECQGVLASVGTYSSGSDQANQGGESTGYPATIEADGCLDASWLNLNIRVTIDVQTTVERVLAVPTTAIRTDASGATYVSVHSEASGEDRRVDVVTGLIAQGKVEVSPAETQVLTPGDLVVVG